MLMGVGLVILIVYLIGFDKLSIMLLCVSCGL